MSTLHKVKITREMIISSVKEANEEYRQRMLKTQAAIEYLQKLEKLQNCN